MTTDTNGRSDADRRWLPTTLVIVATVIAVVSTFTTWVHTQALDTGAWTDASTELIEEEEIQNALAEYLVDQLYDNVDVSTELENLLPEALSGLAGPIAGALRDPATGAVERVIASEQFVRLWTDANRAAHEVFVAILRDDTLPAVSTTDGSVTLDLRTALQSAASAVGLPETVVDRIPEDAGQIVIFQSDELADVQETVQVLDFLTWFLFLLVVVLYGLAIFLSRDRVRTVRNIGIALILGGVSILFLRAIGVRSTVQWVVEDASNRGLATLVGDVITELLRQAAWIGIIVGVFFALFAALLGEHRWAVASRRTVAPWARSNGAVIGTAIVIVLALMWWSPGRVFDRWVTGLTMILLVIAAVVMFAVRTREEFPEGEPPAGEVPSPDDGDAAIEQPPLASTAAAPPATGAPPAGAPEAPATDET